MTKYIEYIVEVLAKALAKEAVKQDELQAALADKIESLEQMRCEAQRARDKADRLQRKVSQLLEEE